MTTSIEEALRSGAVRLVPVEADLPPMPDDERIRKLMAGLGYENSMSLYQAFKQIIKETRLALGDTAWPKPDHTPALVALIEERDRLKANLATGEAQYGVLDQQNKHLQARALAAEAERDALREALALYRDAVRVDVKMDGTKFMGANTSALRRAWEAARALTQETNDGE